MWRSVFSRGLLMPNDFFNMTQWCESNKNVRIHVDSMKCCTKYASLSEVDVPADQN